MTKIVNVVPHLNLYRRSMRTMERTSNRAIQNATNALFQNNTNLTVRDRKEFAGKIVEEITFQNIKQADELAYNLYSTIRKGSVYNGTPQPAYQLLTQSKQTRQTEALQLAIHRIDKLKEGEYRDAKRLGTQIQIITKSAVKDTQNAGMSTLRTNDNPNLNSEALREWDEANQTITDARFAITDTERRNISRKDELLRFVPSPGACDFCETVSFLVREAGWQSLHKGCGCDYVPVFPGQEANSPSISRGEHRLWLAKDQLGDNFTLKELMSIIREREKQEREG